MSEKASMRELVEAVAGPREWSDTRQSWLNRAARRSGLTFRTIKAVWYGEITDESHHSIRLLRYTAQQRAGQQYETIARSLQAIDPEFHSARITEYLDLARALRDLESTTRAGSGNAEGIPRQDRKG